VRKIEAGGRTRSEVTRLDPYARVVEISRMLSGSPDSESARRHARELLGDRGPAR
jgi:DNA repair protein RecN (Recombination protein N)